jgi:hypothetical protein
MALIRDGSTCSDHLTVVGGIASVYRCMCRRQNADGTYRCIHMLNAGLVYIYGWSGRDGPMRDHVTEMGFPIFQTFDIHLSCQ